MRTKKGGSITRRSPSSVPFIVFWLHVFQTWGLRTCSSTFPSSRPSLRPPFSMALSGSTVSIFADVRGNTSRPSSWLPFPPLNHTSTVPIVIPKICIICILILMLFTKIFTLYIFLFTCKPLKGRHFGCFHPLLIVSIWNSTYSLFLWLLNEIV